MAPQAIMTNINGHIGGVFVGSDGLIAGATRGSLPVNDAATVPPTKRAIAIKSCQALI